MMDPTPINGSIASQPAPVLLSRGMSDLMNRSADVHDGLVAASVAASMSTHADTVGDSRHRRLPSDANPSHEDRDGRRQDRPQAHGRDARAMGYVCR
jgi:hypothetical protein